MTIVLASKSPRRREILQQAGIAFTVRAPGIEERRGEGEGAEGYVARLAVEKARAATENEAEYVLAADTVVVAEGRVLEKPGSADEAAEMLRALSGRTHTVLTGVCVRHGGVERTAVEATKVAFVELSEAEIAAYCATEEPHDKAGAYAIQGLASKYIERVEGCYFNVVGLPIARVYKLLREAGYSLTAG